MKYIPIEKNMIPYSFEITLGIENFILEVFYNEREKRFTLNLYDAERNPLVYGEPLIFGEPVFESVRDLRFPIVTIVPNDESGKEDIITWENMGETVFLEVQDV